MTDEGFSNHTLLPLLFRFFRALVAWWFGSLAHHPHLAIIHPFEHLAEFAMSQGLFQFQIKYQISNQPFSATQLK